MTAGSGTRQPSLVARHKVLFLLLAMLTMVLGAVAGSALYVKHQIDSISRLDLNLNLDDTIGGHERPPRPAGAAAGSVNILVAGIDDGASSRILEELRRDHWVPGSHRSDTIMVVHLDADRQKAYVISVPRDTWVPVDGYGMAKINAAFSYGGPPLFVRTMEQFTGLRMDHLVVVDWAGFRGVTDALGGVEIQTAGSVTPTTLDGTEALRYVRERYNLPRGDLDRIQRQQNVIRALSSKLMSADTLTSPSRLGRLFGTVRGNVALDEGLTTARLGDLAASLRELRSSDVTQLTVPVRKFGRIDGQSVVIVNRSETKKLFGAALADELGSYVATHEVDMLPAAASVD